MLRTPLKITVENIISPPYLPARFTVPSGTLQPSNPQQTLYQSLFSRPQKIPKMFQDVKTGFLTWWKPCGFCGNPKNLNHSTGRARAPEECPLSRTVKLRINRTLGTIKQTSRKFHSNWSLLDIQSPVGRHPICSYLSPWWPWFHISAIPGAVWCRTPPKDL